MIDGFHRLSSAQRAWLRDRFPGTTVVRDMSWGLVENTVLHVRCGSDDLVVKAAPAGDRHLAREISAHPRFTESLVSSGDAARLLAADEALSVAVLEYLPGSLVQGTEHEHSEEVHRQAGRLLRRLHATTSQWDADYEATATARALQWLAGPHRIAAATARAAQRILQEAPTPAVLLVPTHGDWQPRNWLIDDGSVRVIDFGRFALRPASSDFARLAAQQWRSHPRLEAAFLAGYGEDPRDGRLRRLEDLREAVGTACWAFQVGDERFERQGHRMLDDALAA